MNRLTFLLCFLCTLALVRADQTNVAEDDASQEAYNGGFDNGKNGGSGFGEWKMASEGNDDNRHSGFFVATSENNKDLNGIAKNGKAWGLYANGTGFEQAVAFRAFSQPLAVGDSFSFMMENGKIEKKFETDDPATGSIGLTLRTGNATDSPSDYNKDSIFEFGFYEGKENYQIYDGSGEDKTDSGVPFTDSGVIVTVTVTGDDTYDLEIQTAADKKLTKLPGRKFSKAGPITSLAIFNRDGEKTDAFFNSLQVAREAK
ncbi:MAG TPA: hypothetical protein VGF73_09695 [Chthoniobacterales bacterium]|jgi:hypothetical protein